MVTDHVLDHAQDVDGWVGEILEPVLGPVHCNTVHAQGQCNTVHGQGQCNTVHGQGQCNTVHAQGQCNTVHAQGQCNTATLRVNVAGFVTGESFKQS